VGELSTFPIETAYKIFTGTRKEGHLVKGILENKGIRIY